MGDQLQWIKRDFVNTQSDLFYVQNSEDETYVKTELGASATYPNVLGINWDTSLSFYWTV